MTTLLQTLQKEVTQASSRLETAYESLARTPSSANRHEVKQARYAYVTCVAVLDKAYKSMGMVNV